MIVYLNCRTFEYDVHSLVKAFFADEDVEIRDDFHLFPAANEADLLCAEDDAEDEEQETAERYISVAAYPPIVPGPDENILYTGRIETVYADGLETVNANWSKTGNADWSETGNADWSETGNADWSETGNADWSETGNAVSDSLARDDSRRMIHWREVKEVTRADLKNAVKIALYELLCRVQSRTLPWGTLTGIRPTKIPMAMLSEGADDDTIREYMQNTYQCSPEKIALATDIARRENGVLSQIVRTESERADAAVKASVNNDFDTFGVSEKKNGYSLYVGIPFCPTRCLYCSFTSYPIVSYRKMVGEYLECVKKELRYTYEQFEGQNPDTIYVGGGTPTALSADELEVLLDSIDEFFDVSKLFEFTVEAGRPDSITPEKLAVLKSHGVTRISVNPQTMNRVTLDLIGRRHSVEDVVTAFNMARRAGFDNINMDIILGLPGEDEDMVRHTLSEIEKLAPDSLTVHSMAIKRAAGMHQFLMEHPDIESRNTENMMALTAECAARLNLKPYYLYRQKNMAGNYENVGYARDGCYGLYNILIMEEVQTIIACGAGTVTKRVLPGNVKRKRSLGDGVSGSFSHGGGECGAKRSLGDGVSGSLFHGGGECGAKRSLGDGVSSSLSNARIERCDNVKDVNMYISRIDEMIDRKRRLMSV